MNSRFLVLAISSMLLVAACGQQKGDVWSDTPNVIDTVQSRRIFYNLAGVFSSYETYEHDALGRLVLRTNYDGAGVNGAWLDGDDTVYDRWGFSYTAEGGLERKWISNNPGPDGVWGNADDDMRGWYEYQYGLTSGSFTNVTRLIYHSYFGGPGLDGQWLTADDPVSSYWEFFADPFVADIRYEVEYIGDGGDGIWFNGNDEKVHYKKSWFVDGKEIRYATYFGTDMNPAFNGAGADGIWFNEDDIGGSGAVPEYNSDGELVRITEFSTGSDLRPFSGDDESQSSYSIYKPGFRYDVYGDESPVAIFNDPGTNATWNDFDDRAFNYIYYVSDPGKNAIYRIYMNSGADQIPYTSDDTPEMAPYLAYRAYYYDDNGMLIEVVDYNNAGLDGLWYTADDNATAIYSYSPVYERQIVDPLIDGIF